MTAQEGSPEGPHEESGEPPVGPAKPRPPGTAGAPEPSAPEPSAPEPGTPDTGTPGTTGAPEPGTPEPGTPEPGTPEPGTPETAAPEPNAPVSATPEPSAPETGTPQASAPETGIPAGQGKRLHPVTPWRRTWAPLAGLFAIAIQDPERLRDGAASLGLGWLLVVLVALLCAAAAYGYLSWRVTRYLVTDTELRIRTGLLFRRTAHLRLDRIQSIDVTRPLLARALGVAKLKMDVVGSGSSDELAFLGDAEATALRAELLARAAGIAPEAAPSAGEAPARELYQVDSRTLGWALALLGSGWGALLVALLVSPLAWLGTGSVFAALVIGLPLLAAVWRSTLGSFLAQYGWTVSESPDGLRLDHGLLQREHATVPPGRVQSVRIVEPMLWRPRGWVRIELEVAGAGHESGLLLPVATRPVAAEVLGRILPTVDVGAALAAVRPAPDRARWAVPVWRRGYGHGVTDSVFVARRGRLRRVHTLVPHAKVQSVRLTQGPWEQHLRLADIHVDHGANGTATARLQDLAYASAEVAAQAERSRLGRKSARPERWLTDRP